MKSRWGLAAVAAMAILAWGSCSNSRGPAKASRMWIATQGDQMVRTYTISHSNGSVLAVGNSNGSPAATGVQPVEMAVTPDGKAMFIVNSGAGGTTGTITAYTISGDGSLKAAGAGVQAGEAPISLALDPGGKFLFVANQGTSADPASGTISVFSISGTSLSEVAGSPFPTEPGPSAVVVSPAGNFLYVANAFNSSVESFSFDTSGALTLIRSYSAGSNPSGLAFSRCAGITSATPSCAAADGNHLFVSNSGSNTITIFSACIQVSATCSSPDGTLAEIPSGSPVPAGVGPARILIDPTSDFVYVVDRGSNEVSAYQYSPVTGALSSIGRAAGGASVFSGGITANISNSTNTFNWVVLTNNGASNLSIFRVSIAGQLIGLSSGVFPVQGQPSAILLR
ncbi:MAG: beta-propeller fold lactonase family protein [Acidobacteria bacterium]|nr:beta-propeller fold lactonase family protein [Acidobacteriota bacterium]